MLRAGLTARAGEVGLVSGALNTATVPDDGVLSAPTSDNGGVDDSYKLAHPTSVAEAFAGATALVRGTAAYDEQDIFRLDLSRFQVVHRLFSDEYSRERFFMYTRRDFNAAAKDAVAGIDQRFFFGEIGNVYANMAHFFSSIADFFDAGDTDM